MSTQREREILEILKENTYVTVDYLASKVHISPSSIRRDLTRLESQGLVKRSHGGVSLPAATPGMAPYAFRAQENKKEKMAIARAASRLIRPDMSIYIDSSTIAPNLTHFLTPQMNLTVFTNNIHLAYALAISHIPVYSVGGYVSHRNHVITAGSFALDMLEHIYVDLMFFASSALSGDGVITDISEEETAVRRVMLAHAKERVFLCHKRRFPTTSRFYLTSLAQVQHVVSDEKLPEEFTRQFADTDFLWEN